MFVACSEMLVMGLKVNKFSLIIIISTDSWDTVRQYILDGMQNK